MYDDEIVIGGETLIETMVGGETQIDTELEGDTFVEVLAIGPAQVTIDGDNYTYTDPDSDGNIVIVASS